jgi:hypothetical protein
MSARRDRKTEHWIGRREQLDRLSHAMIMPSSAYPDGGIDRPSALAVLILMTSWYLDVRVQRFATKPSMFGSVSMYHSATSCPRRPFCASASPRSGAPTTNVRHGRRWKKHLKPDSTKPAKSGEHDDPPQDGPALNAERVAARSER